MLDAPRWLWHASLGQGQSVPGEICLLDERVCLSGRNACRGNVGPMTKSQLIQRIAELNPHLYQRDVERIVSTVFDEISTALADGDRVELRGFGAFTVKHRKRGVGRNPRTGKEMFASLIPGTELGWGVQAEGPDPSNNIYDQYRYVVFKDPNWDWKTFDFDRDVALVNNKLFGTLNAVNPELSDFKKGGGKLIVWHGWNDPGVMPQQTIDYFDSVVEYAAKATGGNGAAYTDDYLRLFMLPGVGHCRGGVGPDRVDWMAALAGWVEQGKKPASLTARAESDGKVVMTRPLCPHPQVARYKGQGDTNAASSFECAVSHEH